MFGFLQGNRRDKVYRQIYAECCSFQRRHFGVDSLMFLSYESIFLYATAVDAGECEGPPASAVTCCRLRSRRGNWPNFDRELARFCSQFALLLASIKLDDDVRDDHSLPARMVRYWFRRRFSAMREYFTALDPVFETQVEGFIRQHLELEQDTHGRVSLKDYVGPTADAFGYLFGLFGNRLMRGKSTGRVLEDVGKSVGAAIAAYDCAIDYRRDTRREQFNPLHNERDVQRAFEFAQCHLSEAGWECVRAFGDSAISVRVARFNFNRVGHSQSVSSLQTPAQRGVLRLRKTRWNLRHGDCDCDPSCCDACGGDCDCGDSHSDCWGCVDCGDLWASDGQRKPGDSEASPPSDSSLIGRTGITTGPLSPSGRMAIDGRAVPARSEGEWIDTDVSVTIVAEQSFGVTVRPEK